MTGPVPIERLVAQLRGNALTESKIRDLVRLVGGELGAAASERRK